MKLNSNKESAISFYLPAMALEGNQRTAVERLWEQNTFKHNPAVAMELRFIDYFDQMQQG